MAQSPGQLNVGQPGNNRTTKRPMYVALFCVGLLLAALMYALDDNKSSKKDEQASVTVDERALVAGQGAGVILPPQPPPPEPPPPEKPTVVVVAPDEGPDKEAEELRKRRQQQLLAALSAPVVKKRNSEGGGGTSTGQGRVAGDRQRQDQEKAGEPGFTQYDPAANIDREQFFQRADTAGSDGWLSRYTREAGRPLEIKTGTVIPAVMVSGINSDLPGSMIAQVSQNVFNTANGKYLLIPQGAKLYGVYDSRVVYGQERVLVAWNRIVFPDGSSVTLGAMPGADMGGYAGFNDIVNNHLLRIFGSAFLMSAIIGGQAYAVDSLNRNDGGDQQPSFQDEMGTALANQWGTVATQMIQKNLNIAPTLEIRPGYRFNVIATKDVAFSEPYTDGGF